MADFNWNDFQEDKIEDEFDWDSQPLVEKAPEKFNNADSAVMSGLQGLSGGFLDEISGGVEAAGRAVGLKGAGGKFSDIGLSDDGPTLDWEVLRDAYREGRNKKRGLLAAQSKEDPWSAGVGNIAGAIASPINKLGKGLSLAKGGAAIGGLNALGYSDADLTEGEVGKALLDTGIGVGGGAVLGKGIEKAAPYIGRGVEKANQGLKNAGKSLYKSGLKKLDQVGARYGKEPVSDLLMERGITGSAEDIFRQMDELGEVLLNERNAILKGATRKGAEVDVNSAMREAQAYVEALKKVDNPEAQAAVRMLQSRIDDYLPMAAKESEDVIRSLPTSEFRPEFREIKGYKPASDELLELPTSKLVQEGRLQPEVLGYDAPTMPQVQGNQSSLFQQEAGRRGKGVFGEPVINNPVDDIMGLPQGAKYETKFAPSKDVALRQNPAEVIYGREVPAQYVPGKEAMFLDQTERIAGPTPLQASAWKTTAANKVGDPNWQTLAMSSQGKGFDKALSGGLRRATEESVESTLGKEAAEALRTKNTDLGRILTSKERALLDAEQEARRNAVTSVDGMLSAASLPMLAAKKTADLSKTTWARTKGGKALSDLSDKISQALQKSPKMTELQRNNPLVFNQLVQKMTTQMESNVPKAAEQQQKAPDSQALMQKTQGTKYAQVLANAQQRGQSAVGATHFILQNQDPEYRRLTLEQEDQDDDFDRDNF